LIAGQEAQAGFGKSQRRKTPERQHPRPERDETAIAIFWEQARQQHLQGKD
jgi:hypothetical protein